jgi:hypothetical protein
MRVITRTGREGEGEGLLRKADGDLRPNTFLSLLLPAKFLFRPSGVFGPGDLRPCNGVLAGSLLVDGFVGVDILLGVTMFGILLGVLLGVVVDAMMYDAEKGAGILLLAG